MNKIVADPNLVIESFKNKILKKFGNQIDLIVLFGSVARKEYSHADDIDVLVVVRSDLPKLAKEIIGIGFEELLNHGWYGSAKFWILKHLSSKMY
ncbi:MAG TPA: nucleotidyltransferase domain-containing protein [Methanosarcinales archaeon]|nr:nucleotidyltransferase domain-containing protein [Methanosarcinales archaeon]